MKYPRYDRNFSLTLFFLLGQLTAVSLAPSSQAIAFPSQQHQTTINGTLVAINNTVVKVQQGNQVTQVVMPQHVKVERPIWDKTSSPLALNDHVTMVTDQNGQVSHITTFTQNWTQLFVWYSPILFSVLLIIALIVIIRRKTHFTHGHNNHLSVGMASA